jgi:phosphoribosylamine-glycine ligase
MAIGHIFKIKIPTSTRDHPRAFEDDGPKRPIIIKSNGPLGRGMGAPWPKNNFQQFKQF